MDELNVSFARYVLIAVSRLGTAELEDIERHVASQPNLKQHYAVETAQDLLSVADFQERIRWALELLRIGGLAWHHGGIWSARSAGSAYVGAGLDEATARRIVSGVISEYGTIHMPVLGTGAVPSAPAHKHAALKLTAPILAHNTILYGPPGTGKTYATIRQAVALADHGRLAREDEPRDKARFDQLRAEGRIGFVTFHQSYGYEDFVEGLRPETTPTGQIRYEVRHGAFRKIVAAALAAMAAAPRIPRPRTFEEVWAACDKPLYEEPPELRGYRVSRHQGKLEIEELHSSAGAAEQATLTREQVRDLYNLGEPQPGAQAYRDELNLLFGDTVSRPAPIAQAVWEALRPYMDSDHAVVDASKVEHYVLVIDEINRGNMSRIFGELITLLEPSKRLGLEDALEVELPSSGDTFGVPPNLHILGTMNTADRSIALLDVALRRRFKFVELMPDPSCVTYELARQMMQALNARVELLLDREHQLGHALFMGARDEVSLVEVLRKDVLPLLKEYFYGDWTRIAASLGCAAAGEGDKDALVYARKAALGGLSPELLSMEEVVVWRERGVDLDGPGAIARIIKGG